jgi:hypothetical protein
MSLSHGTQVSPSQRLRRVLLMSSYAIFRVAASTPQLTSWSPAESMLSFEIELAEETGNYYQRCDQRRKPDEISSSIISTLAAPCFNPFCTSATALGPWQRYPGYTTTDGVTVHCKDLEEYLE